MAIMAVSAMLFYNTISPPVGVRSMAIIVPLCLFVCLFVGPIFYLKNHSLHQKFTKYSVRVTYGRRSILPDGNSIDKLRTSGFVDDVMSPCNEENRPE